MPMNDSFSPAHVQKPAEVKTERQNQECRAGRKEKLIDPESSRELEDCEEDQGCHARHRPFARVIRLKYDSPRAPEIDAPEQNKAVAHENRNKKPHRKF